jgi:exodeoxyribonuclease VII large subunit
MKTFLNIPVEDTTHALTLGAMFDSETGGYFVPAGQEIAKFGRWLPQDLSAHALAIPKSGISLGQFLTRLTAAVNDAFPRPEWVRLEVSGLSSRTGHMYLDAVDRDEDGNELAKCRAVIWKTQANKIGKKFLGATGTELSDGMKVLVSVQPQYKPQYGLSLVIVDIDPQYTIGDMQARLKRIREAIEQLGIADKNKLLAPPVDFTRVAVIAPDGAAGLGDFQAAAGLLERAGLCGFTYFHAIFQGDKAEESLKRAFIDAHACHQSTPVDALVIIRGGGAQADLQWLNQLLLARMVCRFHAPVFTGIGHERDHVILDEYAHRSFGTPSKVIAHIREVISTRALRALRDWESITHAAFALQGRAEANVQRFHAELQTSAGIRLYTAERNSEQQFSRIRHAASTAFQITTQKVDAHYQAILSASVTQLGTAEAATSNLESSIKLHALGIVAMASKEADHQHASIVQSARTELANATGAVEWHLDGVRHAAESSLRLAEREAAKQHSDIVAQAIRQVSAGMEKTDSCWRDSMDRAESLMKRRANDAEREWKDVRHFTGRNLQRAEEGAQEKISSILAHGVGPTLRRGFAMVTVGGRPVSSATVARQHQELEIVFRDGTLKVNETNKGERENG